MSQTRNDSDMPHFATDSACPFPRPQGYGPPPELSPYRSPYLPGTGKRRPAARQLFLFTLEQLKKPAHDG